MSVKLDRFCDAACATGPYPCGPCAREREWVAEVESLRDRLARLANSVQKCAAPCTQCQTLARWCTEGLDLPPVDT